MIQAYVQATGTTIGCDRTVPQAWAAAALIPAC
jgi:hypothetical protein